MMEDSNFATGYAVGRDSNGGYNNGNGMFGNDWAWIIILLLFGWNRNGFGNGFGGGYGGGCGVPCATQADVRSAVDQQTLISKIDQQTYGTSSLYTALSDNLNSNFRGIDNAICTLGYQGAQHANAIQAQLAECCCGIKGEIKDVAYANAMNTNQLDRRISDCCCEAEKMNLQNRFDMQTYNCNTLQAIDKLGDRIIDHLTQDKIATLTADNQALRLAASQAKQNEYLINELRPCPIPAYITCNPYAYTNPCGCGCGNGTF